MATFGRLLARETAVAIMLSAVALALVSNAAADDAPPAQDVAQAEPATAAAPPQARLIPVPLPIRGTVDTQVRRAIEAMLASVDPAADADRPTVVLEFVAPQGGDGASSEFGRSLDLARYLSGPQVAGLRTVAYIPQTVRGHAVLVALACEEIVMHSDAQLGDAGHQEPHVDATVRQGYREVANRRRTIPPAVALGMLDAQLHVQRVTTPAGGQFVLADELPELRKTQTIQSLDTVIPAGEPGLLSADRLRLEYGFVSHLANDRAQLADQLGLPAAALELDPTLGDPWRAVQIPLHGPINALSVTRTQRQLDEAVSDAAVNLAVLEIDSRGGDSEQSMRLANFLADLDPTQLRTVAFVRRASSDAAMVALACDQVVVLPDAQLGGDWRQDDEARDLLVISVQQLMQRKSRHWSLPVAMLDPQLQVDEYQLAGSTRQAYFCAEERQQQADPEAWEQLDVLCPAGELLELDGSRAHQLGLARHVVNDMDELVQRYQLEGPPELAETNWAQELVAALGAPQVSATLLFIAFFALLAEASAPGIGVAGFLSTVCFLLFFWANFLAGTAGWLEVILFVAGLFFIAMEIFVLPGFGIFGLGGGAMVLLSLVLASQTFVIPRNTQQMVQLQSSLYVVVAGVTGMVLAAVTLRKYLEQTTYFKLMTLVPASGAAAEALRQREGLVQYEHLLHQHGQTTTPLVPAGKADFDGELIDVVSTGLPVDKGALIEVLEVHGNRVVVREVK